MNLKNYAAVVRDNWILVVCAALAGLLAAALVTLATAPSYRATSQIYVSVQTQDGTSQNLAQGSTFSQSQVIGFADLATSPLVLEPVLSEGGYDSTIEELASQVVATAKLNTALIDVSVTSSTPDGAADLSNAIASSMATVLPELQRPLDSAVSPVRISITRVANVPQSRSSPDLTLNIGLGLFVGVLGGLTLAVLRSVLDARIKSRDDLSELTDAAVLGLVPLDTSPTADALAIQTKPLGNRAEAVRRIRTNLQFISAPSRPKSIVVTSALPGEGKSTTAANLALAMADAGSRVVIVDADLRRPTLAKVFGLEPAVGLTTVLIGRAETKDVVQLAGHSKLDVITSGEIPPNPSELLGSQQMVDVIRQLSEEYDTVILDSAPLLPVTDGAVLARLADGALVVVGANSTTRPQVAQALAALETVEARTLGIVLNRVDGSRNDPYSYYQYSPLDEQVKMRRRGRRKLG